MSSVTCSKPEVWNSKLEKRSYFIHNLCSFILFSEFKIKYFIFSIVKQFYKVFRLIFISSQVMSKIM